MPKSTLHQKAYLANFVAIFQKMPHLNKILGFVAVSFVLVFLGKISKVELYRAYFRTIEEVEVRNTQGLDTPDQRLELAVSSEVAEALSNGLGPVLLWFASRQAVQLPFSRTLRLEQDQDFVFHTPLHFQVAAPIRGPSLA